MALQLKKFETRSWEYPYDLGSELAIHAGKNRKPLLDLIKDVNGDNDAYRMKAALRRHGFQLDQFDKFAFGCVVCTVKVVSCERMTPTFILSQSQQERAFGEWRVGRFAWELELVEVFAMPIPARGMQGIWHWDVA